MGELSSLISKHPWLVFVAVGIVVLIAWAQSHGGNGTQPSGDVTFTGGGVAPLPMDPNVAATDQARISAGTQNLSTIASLLLGTKQSGDALAASESNTSAALSSSLASTEAGLEVGLAQTKAGVDIASINAASAQSIAATTASAQTTAAQITAETQRQVTAANLQAAQMEIDAQNRAAQYQKDIARAADNTNIFGDVLDLAGKAFAFFGF
jgi:hypothetical protein